MRCQVEVMLFMLIYRNYFLITLFLLFMTSKVYLSENRTKTTTYQLGKSEGSTLKTAQNQAELCCLAQYRRFDIV